MNKFVLSALLCPILGSPLSAQAATDPGSREHRVGAYQPAPSDTPLVREALAYVQRQLTTLSLGEVTEAYTQVVAGLNVKLIVKATGDDGPSEWQFVAYRSLDGKWHFWSASRI
jgi:hypothetical protein